MPIMSLIAAGLIALPQIDPRNMRRLLDAYPTRALREGKSGAVYVRTWVDPAGKAYRCEELRHFGGDVFRDSVCKPLLRLRQRPAVAPTGTVAYGVVTTVIKYTTPGPNDDEITALPQPADVTLDGHAELSDFRIAVLVDESGGVSHCEGFEGASGNHVELACGQARALGQPIAGDADGNPVEYVTTLLVRVEPAAS